MTKVYCQDCKNYSAEELTSKKIEFEFCKILVDDHSSPAHLVWKDPAILNKGNDCPLFELKSGK